MLSHEFRTTIWKWVKHDSRFSPEDFILTEGNDSNGLVFHLVYRFNSDYQFRVFNHKKFTRDPSTTLISRAIEPGQEVATRSIQTCPGVVFETDREETGGENDFGLSEIAPWLDRLYSAITADPASRQTSKFSQQVEELLGRIDSTDSDSSESATAEELLQRVSLLEEILESELQARIDADKAHKNEMDALRQDFEFIRHSINNLERKAWKKSTLVRVLKWLNKRENRELVSDIAESAADLLIEGKPLLPQKSQ